MKFVKLTFNYLNIKKFVLLFILALIPSLFFSLSNNLSSISNYLLNYKQFNINSFSDVYCKVSDINNASGFQILIFIFSFVLLIAFLCEIIGIIERDMRVANFTLKGYSRRINNNFAPVLLGLITLFVLVYLMGLSTALLFWLWHFVAKKSAFVVLLLSSLTTLLLFGLLITILANLIMIIPTMMITGQNLSNSFRSSLKLIHGNHLKLSFGLLFPIMPAIVLIYLERFLSAFDAKKVKYFVTVPIIACLVVYYCVFILVTYYELTGMKREDLEPSKRYFK